MGALKGTPPTLFTSNRADSDQFLHEFRLYRKINRNHKLIQNPYSRVTITLGLMQGPAVNNWVDIMEQKLDTDTTRTANPIAETDEQLWTTKPTPTARINEVAYLSSMMDPTATSVLQAVLSLSPQDRFHVLNSLALDDDDDNIAEPAHGLQINAISFSSPSSPSPALFPAYVPSVPSSPSCDASPSGVRTPLQVTLLGISAIDDELPPLSLPNIIDLTLEDIDDAADTILFASPSPTPILGPAPLLAAIPLFPSPPSFIVQEDNTLNEGVKTSVSTSVSTDIASRNPLFSYYPPIFLP
ncbi:hypothetical protein EDB85DRAFT_2148246 [Lactarius pseudohatsudake]|nr:hypothetical protein EDB85DRAFT_2148246 [Lactarius pseudohatsudake]